MRGLGHPSPLSDAHDYATCSIYYKFAAGYVLLCINGDYSLLLEQQF